MNKTMLTDAQQELNRVLALQPPDKPLRLFFVTTMLMKIEASLRRLLQFFAEAAVPLNLAIIPALLTAEAAGLRLHRKPCIRLLSLNQHGWQHRNHELMGRKCEFGPSRSYAEQFDDIARGQGANARSVWRRLVSRVLCALEPLHDRHTSCALRTSVSRSFRAAHREI
ncbi:MAG: hypothetical protein U0X75_02465 [Acidobacteriota bacterium]